MQWQHLASVAQSGGHENNTDYWQLQWQHCKWQQQQLQNNGFVATPEQLVTHEFTAGFNVTLQQSITVALRCECCGQQSKPADKVQCCCRCQQCHDNNSGSYCCNSSNSWCYHAKWQLWTNERSTISISQSPATAKYCSATASGAACTTTTTGGV